MRVALITEGTYPFVHGGVSVWCDHLLRRLPEVEFHLSALAPTSASESAWVLPPNVVSFETVGLEPSEGSPSFRRYPGSARRWFLDAFGELIDALLSQPAASATQHRFLGALHSLFRVGRAIPIDVGVRSPEAFELVRSRWKEGTHQGGLSRFGPPSLQDVLEATTAMAYFLKPLQTAPAGDVAHVTANGLASLVALAGRWRSGMPVILTEHGVYLRERYLEARKAQGSARVVAFELMFFRLLNDAMLGTADLVTPVSNFNRRWELGTGADPARVRTIYNGVDPDSFPPLIGEPAIPTVSWVGRIDPLKDVKTLIEAFDRLRRVVPAARLRLFGPVPRGNESYHEECRSLVTRCGLNGAVTFEGHTSDVAAAHAAGHVVALSSISEGFPFTVLEAMMSGRATVSTDVGGVAEAVGDAGLLVRPRDPAGMAAALARVLIDDMLRRQLGRAARERAMSLFTLDRMADLYRLAYRSLGAGEAMTPAADGPVAATPWRRGVSTEASPFLRKAVGGR